MAQRFVSSMRPTIYASVASCMHIIAHPWKCISSLPTSRTISWTSCENRSFQIRSSVLFWNCHISQRATFPGWYFLGFFTWPACKNSFWGAVPPMVGWSLLWAGSSPPDLDGPVSAAIWATHWVCNDNGNLPTPSSYSASAILLSISSAPAGASWGGAGGALAMGVFSPFLPPALPPLFLKL